MFFKTIISIILAPIVFIGQLFNQPNEPDYMAPKDKIVEKQEVKDVISITEEKIASTTEKIETKTSSTPNQTPTTTKQVTESKPQINPTPIATKPNTEPAPDFEKINTEARKTIVNIICTTKYNDLNPISGTGVIINSKGLILTNAHIGQYFLLKDFREKDYLNCIGRTGSPAYPKYNLELVYISPNWVKENKSILKDEKPQGTGEHDFAFLRIVNTVDGSNNIISYIEPNTREDINLGEPVLLASYPAGFLGGLSILKDLNIASSLTNIQNYFTFKENTIDIIAVGGTVVSQRGSSGGLVVDKNSSLIGIITTSSDGDTTGNRDLNAITLAYINRALQGEVTLDIKGFLNLDHEVFAKNFSNTTGLELSKIIIDELTK